MDIDYKYNFEQLNERISYRSGADPVIINHRGEYYLFVTISGGWWHSKNLLNWQYIIPDKWPMEDMCAPAALSVRDTFPADRVTDENPRTFWVATQNKPGESLTIDLQKLHEVKAIQVNYTDYKSDIFDSDTAKTYTQFRIHTSADNKHWQLVADLTKEPKRDRSCAYVELQKAFEVRYIKYEHVYVRSPNLAISDIRVFGNGLGKAPKTPANLSVRRDKDERNAFVSWQKVPDAVGYNIRWGIAPDKLYQTHQIWADEPNTLELRALTLGQKYHFAIEAFNANGVSAAGKTVAIK